MTPIIRAAALLALVAGPLAADPVEGTWRIAVVDRRVRHGMAQ